MRSRRRLTLQTHFRLDGLDYRRIFAPASAPAGPGVWSKAKYGLAFFERAKLLERVGDVLAEIER